MQHCKLLTSDWPQHALLSQQPDALQQIRRPSDSQRACTYICKVRYHGGLVVCSFLALWRRVYVLTLVGTENIHASISAQENKGQALVSNQRSHTYTFQRSSILVSPICCLDRSITCRLVKLKHKSTSTAMAPAGCRMLSSGPPFAHRKLRKQRLLHHKVVSITSHDRTQCYMDWAQC